MNGSSCKCPMCGRLFWANDYPMARIAMYDHLDEEEDKCTCYAVKNPWTYYGIVEPGGAMEPNPECPVHFPETVSLNGEQPQ